MKITNVQITNIKGIPSLEFQPGSLTIIRGSNGAGKTSILDAIKAVFDGGHDPTLIRNGADEGRVMIELDGGAQRLLLRVTEKDTKREVRDESGKILKSPITVLKELSSGLTYDPLEFIGLDPKKQADYLKRFVTVPVSSRELVEALGFLKTDPPEGGDDAFAIIDALRAQIYQQRTDTNREHGRLAAMVATFSKDLPTDTPEDMAEQLETAQREYSATQAEKQRQSKALAAEHAATIEIYRRDRDNAIGIVKAEAQRKVDEIRRQEAAEIEAINSTHIEKVATAGEDQVELARQAAEPLQQRIAALEATIAGLQEKQQQFAAAEGKRKQLEITQADVRALANLSEKQSLAIDGLDSLKKKKLSAVQIEGIEIRGGQVYVDSVPFRQVNTARQYMVAMDIAARTLGKLPIMVIDNAEALVGDQWRDFVRDATAAAEAVGLQIVTAVASEMPSSKPLEVQTA